MAYKRVPNGDDRLDYKLLAGYGDKVVRMRRHNQDGNGDEYEIEEKVQGAMILIVVRG